MVGVEALRSVKYFDPNLRDRFLHVIAHEYAHVQQAIYSPTLYADDHPTVLEESFIEGAAEFTAEKLTGGMTYNDFASRTAGHEQSIEERFAADEDKKALSAWLYNGSLEQSGDLGYWVGYRIVKSYYERAADKQRAFSDILEMKDPKTFLRESGWYPGIRLPEAHK